MRIAICDDNKQELLQINQLMDEYAGNGSSENKLEVQSFGCSLDLVAQLEKCKPFDIFLLDVVMPGMNGIELAAEIRSKDQVAKIIFLTSSAEFAVESYSVGAFNYLLKPIQKDKLFSALEKIENKICSSLKQYIVVKTLTGLDKIFKHDLTYIEALHASI